MLFSSGLCTDRFQVGTKWTKKEGILQIWVTTKMIVTEMKHSLNQKNKRDTIMLYNY